MNTADERYVAAMDSLKVDWEASSVSWFDLDEIVGERLSNAADEVAQVVLAVHVKRTFNGDGYSWTHCVEDRQAWPCATARAVYDVLGGEPC